VPDDPGGIKDGYGRDPSSIPSGSEFEKAREPSVALRLPTAIIRNRFAVKKTHQTFREKDCVTPVESKKRSNRVGTRNRVGRRNRYNKHGQAYQLETRHILQDGVFRFRFKFES
jgi:hypothetical protein